MNYTQAAETLQRMANQHAGLVDAYQALQELGGLENFKSELTAQVAQLQKKVSDLNNAYLDATAKAQKQAQQLEADKDTAAKIAAALVNEAHSRASTIVDEAVSKAQDAVQLASSRATELIAAANATVQDLQAKSEGLLAEIKQSQATKDAIDAAAADAQAKVDSIKAHIASLAT